MDSTSSYLNNKPNVAAGLTSTLVRAKSNANQAYNVTYPTTLMSYSTINGTTSTKTLPNTA